MTPARYTFFLNNEAQGPFSREKAEAMIAAREVLPETPCATDGAAEWNTASKFFAFPATPAGGMRLSIKSRQAPAPTATPAEKSAPATSKEIDEEREALDPDIRKKLIRLGLSDAANIDKLTPQQAEFAIRAHEENLKTDKKKKQTAIVAGLAGALLVGAAIFVFTPFGRSACDGIAGILIRDSEAHLSEKKEIARDRSAIADAQKTLAETPFAKPEGRNGKEFFGARVVIPKQTSTELIFTANLAKLKGVSEKEPKVISLKTIPHEIKREMQKSSDVIWKYAHPKDLTDPLSPEELKASWELFKKQYGDKLAKYVAENTADTATKQDDGNYKIGSAALHNLVAVVETADGVPVYFPYGSELAEFKILQQQKLTQEDALAAERYAVKEKQTAGGGLCGIKVRAFGSLYAVKRETPKWYYLGLTRPELDKAPVWVMVSPEEFEKAKIDDEYPTQKLLTYAAYDKPEETKLTGSIEKM